MLARRAPEPARSPGEQTPDRVSPWRLLALLLPALLLFWAWNSRYPPLREYRLYLSEERKDAALRWDQVSESWSEADVKRRFDGYPMRCMPDRGGARDVIRLCVIDVKSLNGVPTMYLNVWFGADGLRRIAAASPWWSHSRGLDVLNTTLGPPDVRQDQKHDGVRLLGWRLPGGAALFYNRDAAAMPLEINATQWVGPSACALKPCVRGGARARPASDGRA